MSLLSLETEEELLAKLKNNDRPYAYYWENKEKFPDAANKIFSWAEEIACSDNFTMSEREKISYPLSVILGYRFNDVYSRVLPALQKDNEFRRVIINYIDLDDIPPKLFKPIIKIYFALAVKHNNVESFKRMVTSKKTPARMFNVAVSQLPDYYLNRVEFRDKRLEEETVMPFLKENRIDIVRQRELALNNSATPAVLKILAKSTDEWVLRKVALHKNTPPKVLDKLSRHEKLIVRAGVAQNRNTPMNVLTILASEKSKKIQDALRKNEAW